MPQEWTTDEQKIFLQEELVKFKRITGRKYTKNWAELFRRWFQRWPERNTILSGIPDSTTLTPEQTKTLAEAIHQRQLQIRRWMHWHAGAGANRAANAKTTKIIHDLLEPKKRTKQPSEVYANIYYKSRVQPEITKGMSIADVKQKIREVFETESPEIKEECQRISDQQKDEKKRGKTEARERAQSVDIDVDADDADETDPVTLHNNIQQCVPALRRVIDHIGRKTKMKFTILMGGLDPLDTEGGNMILTLVWLRR
ncbi:hypothetical protein EV363DRAFT_1158891 [Boletus edulis]|nr:hypothetical protein EV363DRAFT_1165327 [Boletus edulis]KAF8135383.1 hypothetical protein EV363DRAFT_1158891 [Boletus edulis]